MKRITTIFFIICSAVTLYAQGTKFEHTEDWNTIREIATTRNKLIFIDISTSWCSPCKMMDKEIFPNDTLGTFMNDKFVCFHLDGEKGLGKKMVKKFTVTGYPTFLIFNAAGRLVQRSFGSKPTATYFLDHLKELLADQFLAKGYSDNMDLPYPAFYNDYYDKSKTPEAALISKYMLSQKDWLKEENWAILMNFGSMLEGYTLWSIQHAADIRSLFGVTITTTVVDLAREKIVAGIKDKNELLFKEGIHLLDSLNTITPNHIRTMMIDNYQLEFYATIGKWSAFKEQVLKIQLREGNQFNSRAALILTRYTIEPALLQQAIEWLQMPGVEDDISTLLQQGYIFTLMNKPVAADSTINKYFSIAGKHPEDDLLSGTIDNYIYAKMDSNILSFCLSILEKSDLKDKVIKTAYLKTTYYLADRNWDALMPVADQYAKMSNRIYDHQALLYVCYVINQECNDEKVIGKAISWLEPLLNISPVYIYTFQYAALLYKHKDYAAAKKWTLTTLEIMNNVAGIDTVEVKELLKKIEAALAS